MSNSKRSADLQLITAGTFHKYHSLYLFDKKNTINPIGRILPGSIQKNRPSMKMESLLQSQNIMP